MPQVSTIGGGGCPAYDVLVPDLPFDFLQPRMQRQVTQAGYGGPFVIRGNPIGAIFDAIRGFCFPVPMQASSDGGTYADLSGSGLDSYGGATSTDLGSLGGGTYGGGFGNPYVNPATMCGAGTTYDYTTQMCVPTMATPTAPAAAMSMATGTTYSCDDPNYLMMVANQEGTFYAQRDVSSLCSVSQPLINSCLSASAVPAIKAQWLALSGKVAAHIKGLGCASCATCKQNTGGTASSPTTSPAMGTPTPTGGTTMMPMTPAATGNPMMGTPSNVPFGYIPPVGQPAGSTPSGLLPSASVASRLPSSALGSIAMAARERLPMMPDTSSLTEGNIYMTPSSNPLQGMFDPNSNIPRARIRRGFSSFSQRMVMGR